MTVAPEQAAEGSTQQPVHTRALIIGTGFSGLGMGIALQGQGVDFLILEKAAEIGGTWRDNSYPGCACDVPSHLYSFSFEPKATWSSSSQVPAGCTFRASPISKASPNFAVPLSIPPSGTTTSTSPASGWR